MLPIPELYEYVLLSEETWHFISRMMVNENVIGAASFIMFLLHSGSLEVSTV
jgi:hypothetical protein